jgi:mRNA-degrading endonuclease HigB of HigAB toxin-antitoxin module
LISELNVFIQPIDNSHINQGLGDWYSNIFEFNKKKNLVFLNTKTLISFVIPNLTKKDLKGYQDLFLKGLSELLLAYGIENEIVEKIFIEYIHLQIAKTESKSYIGFMNDTVQDYKFIFDKGGHEYIKTIDHFNFRLNKKPVKALDWKFAVDKLEEVIKKEYK